MIWWWQFTCKKACTPESVTNLGCDVKNKSIQEGDVSILCVGSLIIWCKPSYEINVSVCAPSKLVLSLTHQLHGFALKSHNAVIKNGLKVFALSKFNSRFFFRKSKT